MNPLSETIKVKVTPLYNTPENVRKAERLEAFMNWMIKQQQLTAEMN